MLLRIKKISGIGKFKNFRNNTPNDGAKLEEKTIIFGKNTAGKTTLSAIFDSLMQDDADLILKRKTFGYEEMPFVELEFSEDTNKFEDSMWQGTKPRVLQFNQDFINNNVFTGNEINPEHLTELNQLILGDKNNELREDISSFINKIKELTTKDKAQLEGEYAGLIANQTIKLALDDFIKLKEIENIATKLKDIKNSIKQEENSEKLNALYENNVFKSFYDTHPNLENTLEESFKISIDAINDHIKNRWNEPNHSKDFLKEGLDLLKPAVNECVFCGQSLSDESKDLIEEFSNYFNEEYMSLNSETNKYAAWFLNLDPKNTMKKQILEFEKVGIEINLTDQEITNLTEKHQELCNQIDDKQKNLNESLKIEEVAEYKEFKEKMIGIYNKLTSMRVEKEDNEVSLEELNTELDNLNINKLRFSREGKDLCERYNKLQEQLSNKRKERDAKADQLLKENQEIFDLHQETINNYLRKLNADFKVVKLTPQKDFRKKDDTSQYCSYEIEFFNEYNIGLYRNDESPDFSCTLSTSDRRRLALAFFFSIAKHTEDLEDTVLVFDDPVSSFDKESRLAIVQVIADIKNNNDQSPNQRVVLTHNEDFVIDLLQEPIFENSKLLGIKVSNDNNSSIAVLENEEFLDDEITKKIKYLYSLLNEAAPTGYFDDCRTVVEFMFKTKHYKKLEQEIRSRGGGVRTYANKVFEDDEQLKQKFQRLCNYLNIPLHDGTLPQRSDGDSNTILTLFFECLEIL